MSTSTKPRPSLTRDEAAERLKAILGDEPQSEAALARHLGIAAGGRRNSSGGGDTSVVHNALGVLAARHQAKLVPGGPGRGTGGWVVWDSAHEAAIASPQEVEFPYKFSIIRFDEMFVDETYQRPLTSFARQIEKRFDPVLFQTLVLSDRGTKHQPRRYALIDGQTRWVAATSIGVVSGPTIIFSKLTPEAEADIFWRLQKHRRGMISWHRFRAQLGSGDKTSLAIQSLVRAAGFELGDRPGQIKAVGALEACYKTDDFQLERVLSDLREAWPEIVPEGSHIRGLHFFFRHFPLDKKAHHDVDDERLVSRLKATGPDGLHRKMLAAKQLGGSGNTDRFMAMAIQSVYLSGGRS